MRLAARNLNCHAVITYRIRTETEFQYHFFHEVSPNGEARFAFCLHPYVNVKELCRKRVAPLLLSNAISIETHRDNYISAGLRRYTAQNSLLWITCEQKTPIQRGFSGSRATGAQSSPAEGESMVLTGREDLSFTG